MCCFFSVSLDHRDDAETVEVSRGDDEPMAEAARQEELEPRIGTRFVVYFAARVSHRGAASAVARGVPQNIDLNAVLVSSCIKYVYIL